jgi:hypothetical protein
MRNLVRVAAVFGLALLSFATVVKAAASPDDRDSVVIVFKDGHRQSFAMTEIVRIDFRTPAMVVYRDGHQEKIPAADIVRIEFAPPDTPMMPGRNHFIGKWEVGEGNGLNFFITLEADGNAIRSIGAQHGTWTLVNGEARISWDDGWHDVIRKVGTKHEKLAFEPGKSLDDTPSNVTDARNTQPKPI